jgi:hypothetical protein
MDIDFEEAHEMLNKIAKLIEEEQYFKARGLLRKFMGTLESMEYRLRSVK